MQRRETKATGESLSPEWKVKWNRFWVHFYYVPFWRRKNIKHHYSSRIILRDIHERFKYRSSQHFSVDFGSVRLSWKISDYYSLLTALKWLALHFHQKLDHREKQVRYIGAWVGDFRWKDVCCYWSLIRSLKDKIDISSQTKADIMPFYK